MSEKPKNQNNDLSGIRTRATVPSLFHFPNPYELGYSTCSQKVLYSSNAETFSSEIFFFFFFFFYLVTRGIKVHAYTRAALNFAYHVQVQHNHTIADKRSYTAVSLDWSYTADKRSGTTIHHSPARIQSTTGHRLTAGQSHSARKHDMRQTSTFQTTTHQQNILIFLNW